MLSRRRILTATCATALAGGLGAIASGCGNKRRGGPPPTPPPGPFTPAQPAPVVEAPPPDRGQILGQGPEEPLAPPGSWLELHPGRVAVWVPRYLARRQDLLALALWEIDHVAPAYGGLTPYRPLDPTWRGVDADPSLPPVAVVIMDPGLAFSTAAVDTGIAAETWTAWVRDGVQWEAIHVAERELRRDYGTPGYEGELVGLARGAWRRLTRTGGR